MAELGAGQSYIHIGSLILATITFLQGYMSFFPGNPEGLQGMYEQTQLLWNFAWGAAHDP
jgi:hypothetical protein